jgi:voltage-gated potassium channel
MFHFPSDRITGIMSLYTETVHIVARKNLNVKEIKDLESKKISVGEKNSGTEFNTSIILGAKGLSYNKIIPEFITFEQTINSLKEGSIDVAFLTGGIPFPNLSDITHKLDFIPISINVVEKLVKNYPYFVSTIIRSETYPYQYREVPTVGVKALLVANRNVKNKLVEKIMNIIFENQSKLEKVHPVLKQIKLKNSLEKMTVPLHPAAKKYYEEKKLIKKGFRPYFIFFLYLVIFLIVIIFIKKYSIAIKRIISKNIYLIIGMMFVFIYFIATIGIYLFEKRVNENFKTIIDSFWSTIIYILAGFEGRNPITLGGKIFSLPLLFASFGIFGVIIGKFVSIFLKSKEVKMPKNIKKHIVICNWSDKGEKIVKELHAHDAAPNTGIIVISLKRPSNEQELRTNYPKEYSNVEFRESDPSLHQVLEGANAHLAKSIIILADENSSDPDAESGLIALAINNIWSKRIRKEIDKRIKSNDKIEKEKISREVKTEEKYRKPHIVANVINHRKIEHLKNAGVDELICATDYGIGILAQCALYEKLSDVYQQLLTYSKDTCEFYLIENEKVSEWIDGKAFKEVTNYFNKHRTEDNPAILIGLKRGKEVILNPRGEGEGAKEEYLKFEKGDCLIFMSYKYPDLDELINIDKA